MRQVLIAAIATLGFAGIAAAQEAPVHNGYNGYSAAVTSQDDVSSQAPVQGVDYTTTSSYRATVPAQGDAAATMEIAKRAHR